MDKTVKSIICDGCEKEMIKCSSYPKEYGLTLSCDDFNTRRGGMSFAVMQYPIIARNHHFCGLGCLSNWIKKGDKKNE